MAKQILGSFSSFELTSEETLRGQILTLDNCYCIQNLLSECVEEKVNLKYDPEHPQRFIQQEAELQGKIGILKYLLTCSTEAIKTTYEQAQASS